MTDPTQRFSTRVENYIRYRPGYPPGVLATLQAECALTPASVVADVGSGTGILSEIFLRNGNTVYAIEPNREMRQAGERLMQPYPGFHSLDGRAEDTSLPASSIDFVVAGQAFHWFDDRQAQAEFLRILKPDGWVMLVWNERETGSTPFLAAYEQLLHRYSTDYAAVDHRRIDEIELGRFFDQGYLTREFTNRQDFDHAGLLGRLLSSSYAPEAGHPNHEPMLAELKRIFDAHAIGGLVGFEYTTRMYFGRLEKTGPGI